MTFLLVLPARGYNAVRLGHAMVRCWTWPAIRLREPRSSNTAPLLWAGHHPTLIVHPRPAHSCALTRHLVRVTGTKSSASVMLHPSRGGAHQGRSAGRDEVGELHGHDRMTGEAVSSVPKPSHVRPATVASAT